jgi:S-adenosylmethionine:tRNA ribosyltransferase-isomerase
MQKYYFFIQSIFSFTFAAALKTEALTDYRNIKISDYSYLLPDEKIARYPLPERDSSNLLVWQKGIPLKETFRNIGNYLPNESLLVFNNTRVIHARLFFRKESGTKIEVFCLEPVIPADYQLAFQQKEKAVWKCMVGNAKKWKEEVLSLQFTTGGIQVELQARKTARYDNSFLVEFSWTQGVSFAEVIGTAGVLPIPPYLHRETEPADEVTYQTVFAKADGSVAAPTAGLHFTDNVLKELSGKKIALREITLHVGAGTFQPVKSDTMEGHNMHHETVIIPGRFIEELVINPRKIIAVGTTSVRSLESLYWLGLKLQNQDISPGILKLSNGNLMKIRQQLPLKRLLKIFLNFLTGTTSIRFVFRRR